MRSPLVWYLMECMAAPKKNGVLVVQRRRNPEIIQTSAIPLFVLSGNQYANGYMAMHMGIWHIACGSHVDVKRAYSHLAGSVHETTARRALETMADDSFEPRSGLEFLQVWEGGVGLENRMICGCACTAIGLEDCEPDAFDFVDCFTRILKNEHAELTVSKLHEDIDWDHIRGVQSLHVLRALCSFVPSLKMREGQKTKVVPLGCNAKHEIEISGMMRALLDFFRQAGLSPKYAASLIAWVGGDGGSVLAIDAAKKYSATMYDPEDVECDYKNLYNVMSTLGIWHTQLTMQNSIAANHYGPVVTCDPSSLSRSGACAGFKWPMNFKDCGNYYPLSRSMTAIWETHVLDCWRLELEFNNYKKINPYFDALANEAKLPTFEWFLAKAEWIVDCYMTPDAYEQALSETLNNSAPDHLKFPIGKPHSSCGTISTSQSKGNDEPTTNMAISKDPEVEGDAEDKPPTQSSESKKKKPATHVEEKGFTGDRVLANTILFMMEYSWWIEATYAIPEGDIGWIWIFVAAVAGNTNYVNLLLEMYCLFQYKSSQNLKDAIWNNWLVNVTDMVKKSGKNFDDKFLRKSPSPILHEPPTSSPSGSIDEDDIISVEGAASDEEIIEKDDEINLLEERNNHSRLDPGPELMPSIDPNSGRLITEWEDDVEELLEGDDTLDSGDASKISEFEQDSDIDLQ
ncbi:hypothetical protein BT96DRAFT_991844 [Gymnopus androsaceus JB14]|uniref:DUF6589 domain-containing protein n=1 Tax=Gymnopus androsaceus JB14 TaxID=1447944 RepID=A0A6A4HWS1_9AGAR|nr:hypothetical protein BT96DRAFT_991844 [Gymnopus androsaceus JB14]